MARPADTLLDSAGATLRVARPEVPGQSKTVRVELLEPNPWNPNEQDDETFLKEKTSIRRFGFVVPIIVRPLPKSERLQIIDGEHRWRAAVELGVEYVPVHDLGPIGDFEAEQLTIILNELKGKPNERKLQASLKRLLATDTLDRLTEVMPYSKEVYAKLAGLPEFNFDKLQQMNAQRAADRAEKRWVERVFRMPKEAAEEVDRAIAAVKQGDEVSDGEALGEIARRYLDD